MGGGRFESNGQDKLRNYLKWRTLSQKGHCNNIGLHRSVCLPVCSTVWSIPALICWSKINKRTVLSSASLKKLDHFLGGISHEGGRDVFNLTWEGCVSFFFFFFGPPHSIWISQDRDQILATLATHAAIVVMPDPLTHCARPGIEPTTHPTSQVHYRWATRELLNLYFFFFFLLNLYSLPSHNHSKMSVLDKSIQIINLNFIKFWLEEFLSWWSENKSN